MEERKDIDRLFQEKFKDFEQNPRPELWARIEQELNKDKKKRRVVPIWWRLGGVAALLLLFFSIALNIFNSSSNLSTEQPIADTKDEIFTDESTETPDSIDQINDVSSDAVVTNDQEQLFRKDIEASTPDEQTRTTPSYNTTAQGVANVDKSPNSYAPTTNRSEEPSKTRDGTDNKKEYYALNNTPVLVSKGYSSLNYAITADPMPNQHITEKEKEGQSQTIEEAIAAAEALKENPIEEETIKERWSVSPVVAPVYSMGLDEGSTIHSQFNENSKSSDVTMSYGVGGSYAIGKRLKVRAGINRVDFTNTTNDVMTFVAVDVASRPTELAMANIRLNGDANVYLISANTLGGASAGAMDDQMGQLIMDYGYIELPLALEYRLVDRKFGVNVIGGFSTFLLNNNQISTDFNGQNTVIGEASNLNDTSYSANFGIGFDYSISNKINVMLEPTLKYQFNTFSNNFGNVQPMFIGIYTGLSFKF